jgi:hypothetical protein
MRNRRPAARQRGPAIAERAPVPGRGRWVRIKQFAISTFVLVHLAAITCWALPFSNPLLGLCRDFVRPYLRWSGLFQSWDMFSPGPKAANSYVDAIVLYGDGETRNWAFPRMEQLSLQERYFKERYRKFTDVLEDEKNAVLWPDAARFIARVNNNRPAPVKMVFLVRHWSAILARADGSYMPAPWDSHVFFAQKISAGDLE